MTTLKTVFVADTVVDPILKHFSRAEHDIRIEATVAPYNQVTQILLNDTDGVWQSNPDLCVVWTTPERLFPPFARLLNFASISQEAILSEVDAFVRIVRKAASRVKLLFIVSWSLPPHMRWIQAITMKHRTGVSNILMHMNLRLAEQLADIKNVVLLDSSYWYASLQKPSYDPKLYAVGKVHYSREFFVKAANEIVSVASGAVGKTKKLIVCDLDNTLWGGVIGDDGINHIKLGGIDPIGESFVAFQKSLKALSSRGILLAIASKNEESIALDTIQNHSEMILRKEDFVTWRINWEDKAQNIIDMVKELNIGIDAVVFFDDNPSERDRVRMALPEVYVPDLPQDVTAYPSFLSNLACFETINITHEDRGRTQLYKAEQSRNIELSSSSSFQEWLQSLEIEVIMSPVTEQNLTRVVQLMNKTNQFNLSTRRMTEDEFLGWLHQETADAVTFRVKDRFGDLGLIGVVSTIGNGEGAREIVDFVMSCRAMGKQVEHAILYMVAVRLMNSGLRSLKAAYKETPKNKPILEFLRPQLKTNEQHMIDLDKVCKPNHIRISEE
ncbi:HAD-IIIC family phosphatase [Alicyclobacillus ferrooxydans]|uniref:FkbH-like protein n=1 Tax=Alicyclobacillus ferrooxydans TaxID=471514 RepID=A0A0P9CAH6_9BACL|nr:HAD-IIIC family phosphatase [Alicyclobacillus ferrooxydans]KPV42387.1 FkbH-like protein [Alicyclobacillus ferrooxydans]